MPVLSAFTPCGMLEMSSAPSHAETWYNELQTLYGHDVDFTLGTYQEAKLYAWAMGLGSVQYELEHGGNQAYPDRVFDLIPLLESDFGLKPGPNDTAATRRVALGIAMALTLGGIPSNLVNTLKTLLGPGNFLSYFTGNGSGGQTVFPVAGWPSTGPNVPQFTDVRIPMRTLQLVDPVVATGSPVWCAYKNLDPTTGALQLYAGDSIVVQGENTSLEEVVIVSAVATSPPAGSQASSATLPAGTQTWAANTTYAKGQYVTPLANTNGWYFVAQNAGSSGATEPNPWPSQVGLTVTDGNIVWQAVGASFVFQATFQKAHDIGASITTGTFPYWWSTQKQFVFVISAALATDPETRRKMNVILEKMVSGTAQWAIVQPASTTSTGGVVGPLTVGSAIGTQTIAAINFTNSN
jgi:hypothetical protein